MHIIQYMLVVDLYQTGWVCDAIIYGRIALLISWILRGYT